MCVNYRGYVGHALPRQVKQDQVAKLFLRLKDAFRIHQTNLSQCFFKYVSIVFQLLNVFVRFLFTWNIFISNFPTDFNCFNAMWNFGDFVA